MENKELYKNDIAMLNAKEYFELSDFIKVVQILRVLCPWDKEQTHQSIRNNLLEEAYEAVEGIDKDDASIMKEELGDLFLQVVFHAVMGEEKGEYDIGEIMTDVCKKLIRRHPHIFAAVEADTTDKVLENWDNIKKIEKENKTLYDELCSISSSLPALMRSEKVCKKIKKRENVVFDSEPISFEEAGEVLFNITSRCFECGIDAEEALSKYTERKIEEYANN